MNSQSCWSFGSSGKNEMPVFFIGVLPPLLSYCSSSSLRFSYGWRREQLDWVVLDVRSIDSLCFRPVFSSFSNGSPFRPAKLPLGVVSYKDSRVLHWIDI